MEDVEWLETCNEAVPDLDTLTSWMDLGKKKLILDDESNFCDPAILTEVLRCKVCSHLHDTKSKVNERKSSFSRLNFFSRVFSTT